MYTLEDTLDIVGILDTLDTLDAWGVQIVGAARLDSCPPRKKHDNTHHPLCGVGTSGEWVRRHVSPLRPLEPRRTF